MSAAPSPDATPTFAVVGHPNKGKSSLVATLARDEQVRIAAEPGTTTRAVRYPLRLDGETLYALVDTPGFQRARAALAWMREEAERSGASAADRADVVARFVAAPGHAERFPDEVALLEPVVAGAGILYVVDGAVPYGSEYEAEMEILRWTGQPSLAVINPIGATTHVDAWRRALGQYFKVVRVVDALQADFETQLDLLRAFGELDERWRPALRRAVAALEAERERRLAAAATEIARLLTGALALSVERRLPPDTDPEPLRPELEERYRAALRRLERRSRDAIEALYGFSDLDVEESEDEESETERALLEEDLFARDTWMLFGLRRRDLVATGAAAGAAAGSAIDVAVGGTSLLAGAALGGLVGGALGWLGSDRLAELELLKQPLGGTLAKMGPARSPNLAFVLLGRARLHHALVSQRTHARRDRKLRLDAETLRQALPVLEGAPARRLAGLLKRAERDPEALEAEIRDLLAPETTRELLDD